MSLTDPSRTPKPEASDGDPESASLATLTAELLRDGRELIRQEVALASIEIRGTAKRAAKGGLLVSLGALLLGAGLVLLVVFLVLALGVLLGGRTWLSALIVGLVFAVIGAAIARRGSNRLRATSVVPSTTIDSVRQTARWAQEESARIRNPQPKE